MIYSGTLRSVLSDRLMGFPPLCADRITVVRPREHGPGWHRPGFSLYWQWKLRGEAGSIKDAARIAFPLFEFDGGAEIELVFHETPPVKMWDAGNHPLPDGKGCWKRPVMINAPLTFFQMITDAIIRSDLGSLTSARTIVADVEAALSRFTGEIVSICRARPLWENFSAQQQHNDPLSPRQPKTNVQRNPPLTDEMVEERSRPIRALTRQIHEVVHILLWAVEIKRH
jgi:hypothetical protein